jgi:hypothetical protein
MKKPHLEVWRYNPLEEVVDAQGTALTVRLDAEDAQLIAAAPDMARALLALTSKGHTPESLGAALSAGMTALRKARVLP